MPESHEPAEAIRSRRPSWLRTVVWSVLGGILSLHLYVAGLLIFGAIHGLFSGARGSEFVAYGTFQLFYYGGVPALVYGAVVGAVAARYSRRVAAATAVILPVVMLAIAWKVMDARNEDRMAEFEAESQEMDRYLTAEASAWKVIVNTTDDGLSFRSVPPSWSSAPADQPPVDVFRKPGDSNDVFTESEPGPPGSTATLTWQEPDQFQIVFDFQSNETEETWIDPFCCFVEVTATLDGTPADVPVEVHPADRPQQVIVRGRLPTMTVPRP